MHFTAFGGGLPGVPAGEMKPLIFMPMCGGTLPTPGEYSVLMSTCDVLEKRASLMPLSPAQSPLTDSMSPFEYTRTTIAT